MRKEFFTVFAAIFLMTFSAGICYAQEVGSPALKELDAADEDVDEKYRLLDLEDAWSVREMIKSMDRVRLAVHGVYDYYRNVEDKRVRYDNDFYIDSEIRDMDLGGEGETYRSCYFMNGGRSCVLWIIGGDSYTLDYLVDGVLIGHEIGYSSGRIAFSGTLPGWKESPDGEDWSVSQEKQVIQPRKTVEYEARAEYVKKYWDEAVSRLESY